MKNNKGFTVIELVVSIALLALILVPVANFFTNSFKFQGRTAMRTSATRAGQAIIESFKNKDYLGLTIKEGNNDLGLSEYINEKRKENISFSDGGFSITGENGWIRDYNNVKYNVSIKLTSVSESDQSNFNIPTADECFEKIDINNSNPNGNAYINTTGDANINNTAIEYRQIGAEITLGDKVFITDHPTIVLKKNEDVNDYLTGIDSSNPYKGKNKLNLWINNLGYGYFDGNSLRKTKDIRVVKDFEEELDIYINGAKLGIVEGPKGINVNKNYYKINSFLLNSNNTDSHNNLGELIFNAEMVITNVNDETVSDNFTFTFPVDYDYSNESGNLDGV